jgi:hypothetical protein
VKANQMFKVGDRVWEIGKICFGIYQDETFENNHIVVWECDCHAGLRLSISDQRLQLIKQLKSSMGKLNNMMKRLLDADTQTLVKAEYINGDLELTEKGRGALYSVLFADKKADLVALAQGELDEAKKSN